LLYWNNIIIFVKKKENMKFIADDIKEDGLSHFELRKKLEQIYQEGNFNSSSFFFKLRELGYEIIQPFEFKFTPAKTYTLLCPHSFPCSWGDFYFEKPDMPTITISGGELEETGEWDYVNSTMNSIFYDIFTTENEITEELTIKLIKKYLGITVEIKQINN